jgi:hypothetical protein
MSEILNDIDKQVKAAQESMKKMEAKFNENIENLDAEKQTYFKEAMKKAKEGKLSMGKFLEDLKKNELI